MLGIFKDIFMHQTSPAWFPSKAVDSLALRLHLYNAVQNTQEKLI